MKKLLVLCALTIYVDIGVSYTHYSLRDEYRADGHLCTLTQVVIKHSNDESNDHDIIGAKYFWGYRNFCHEFIAEAKSIIPASENWEVHQERTTTKEYYRCLSKEKCDFIIKFPLGEWSKIFIKH